MPVTIPVTERNSSGPVIPQQVIFSRADGTRFGGLTNSTGTVFVVPVFFNADGSAQFFLPSEADTTYVVQATTNLVDWVNLSTNIATASFIDLVDVDAKDYPHRFYRAIALENLTGNQIGTLGLNATGEFTFEYRGEAGRQYVLETSTNLSNWFSVLTNSSTGSPLVYTNLVPDASSHGFFRLRRLPRP